MTACAFTGHRMLAEADIEPLRLLLQRGIAYVYQNGVRRFYAGGALGFDMLAEEEVLSFRKTHPDVTLHLLLPHKGQEARWRYAEKMRYRSLLSRADSVRFLSDAYYDGVMRERNAALVAEADCVIAYLVTGGGTAQTVSMAKKRGLPVYNLAEGLASRKAHT